MCLIEEGGADVEVQTRRGAKPLHQASKGGHSRIVKYLIERAGAVVTPTVMKTSMPTRQSDVVTVLPTTTTSRCRLCPCSTSA
jgi:hypothetical protein